MAVKYLATGRLQGTTAERTALTGSQETAPDQNHYQELDRATANGSSTTLSTGTFTTKENLMVMIYIPTSSNNHDPKLRFNGDNTSSTDYDILRSDKGSNYTETNNSYYWDLYMHGGSQSSFYVGFIDNRDGEKKLCRMLGTYSGAIGDNATGRREWQYVYYHSDQIDEMAITSENGNFPTGTEIIVLGMDDDPSASGTNYWQELGRVDELTSAGAMSTGTFADKNYLYTELFSANSGTNTNKAFYPNSDNSSSTDPCTFNYNANYDTSDGQTATRNAIQICVASSNDEFSFTRCWICNHHDKEKLFIVQTAEASSDSQDHDSGAGAPDASEFGGKWTNTSVGITKLNVSNDGGTQVNQKVGSYMRVWGND